MRIQVKSEEPRDEVVCVVCSTGQCTHEFELWDSKRGAVTIFGLCYSCFEESAVRKLLR